MALAEGELQLACTDADAANVVWIIERQRGLEFSCAAAVLTVLIIKFSHTDSVITPCAPNNLPHHIENTQGY